MLKAKDPQQFADFITGLCGDLIQINLSNFGIFDKFTGDGILSFFPDFFSGEDSIYRAIKAANECHVCFHKHYDDKRHCFNSILTQVGLGIGIDYGEVHLAKMEDGLTVIGTPVVYACRFSGDKADSTLLNQSAYEIAAQRYGGYVNFQEYETNVKHEGETLAYLATLGKQAYQSKMPPWLNPPPTP